MILQLCQVIYCPAHPLLPCFLYAYNNKLLSLYLTTICCSFYLTILVGDLNAGYCLQKISSTPLTPLRLNNSSVQLWNSGATTISSELNLFIFAGWQKKLKHLMKDPPVKGTYQYMMIGWLLTSAWWLDLSVIWTRRSVLASCFWRVWRYETPWRGYVLISRISLELLICMRDYSRHNKMVVFWLTITLSWRKFLMS